MNLLMNINFSIIIPAYDNLELFKTAISSVINQKEANYEVIVSDDSSDTLIETYVKSLQNRAIIYHHNQPALGAVKNWNKGLNMARGKYIILLHHDEAFGSNYYLKNIAETMETDIDITVSDVRVFVNGKRHDHTITKSIKPLFLKFPILLLGINVIGPCACLAIRRDLIEPFKESLQWLVDVEWYYRLLKKSRIARTCPEFYIISNHGHKKQISQNIDIDKARKNDYKELAKLYPHSIWRRIMLFINNILSKNKVKNLFKNIAK